MAFPPKKRAGDEDIGAISALMSSGNHMDEEPDGDEMSEDPEAPQADPMTLVTELQRKVEELAAALA